jgi:serine/threonine protein kinase/formylglycine-generating enzyme required for sulfatase activity
MSDSPEPPNAGTQASVVTEGAVEGSPPSQSPRQIGRYRVEKLLGHGGFGLVYLAHDDALQRWVAIKVPHRDLIRRPEDADLYLAEARTVARLDHANIVAVFDVGGDGDFPCFVVSKYIEGSTLAKRMKDERLPLAESAELVATVAEALHYAHCKGIVHRDIKPGNILLDAAGKPYVSDFGLALKEENVGKGPKYCGTLPYMSPEQARGEGHRVDGRSDIFSLGVVFYELLTGRRPFRSDARSELLEEISNAEPRPPRQIDDALPKELERICLKALSKRAADRYTTARDFAGDLRKWLAGTAEPPSAAQRLSPMPVAAAPTTRVLTPVPTSDPGPVRIVPKGLRSFDEHDADFFLELLPGPRDRAGLPESIRFWKARIENVTTAGAFALGLIYGPSGCGKSSLVKAGLLPRLARHVKPIYIEATADETETRLLNGLRKHCPDMPGELGLKNTLAALRGGLGVAKGEKILLVLDQFEQWLHAKQEQRHTELVQALRQCDGERVQCIIMVRDDFWLSTTRFLGELEVDLLQGQNTAVVDLFDLDHARKVLIALGRALGKLPERSSEMSADQREFLERVVSGLAQDGKVICVRLALFAEMIKGKPWLPATLKAVGGMSGVGVAFLEETFASPAANPKHRLHQAAARAVLAALLPETGTDIKGNMRSQQELRAASGYAQRPKDFAELIRVLDRETRLITPTDPEGTGRADVTPSDFHAGVRYYQLTHDYLVHSLRDWLTRKQKETWHGRAELRLAEQTALWNSKPEKRHLPSVADWARIRLLTRSQGWSPPQRKMMRRADRHYLVRSLLLLASLFVVGWGVLEYSRHMEARALRAQLLRADVAEVPAILKDIEPHRRLVDPLLREALASEGDAKSKLKLSLALVGSDPSQVSFLYERLLQASPQDFPVIRQVLASYKDDLIEPLWAEMSDRERERDRRFRAACALIEYAPDHPRWNECAAFVIEGLLAESPLDLNYWKETLKPVRNELLPALAESLETSKWGDSERRAIIDFYRAFSDGNPDALTPLHARLIVDHPGLSAAEKAKRKAALAAALAALGRGEEVWPLLIHTQTPTLRSFLIERLGSSGIEPKVLKDRLGVEKDTSARRALLLTLGSFPADRIPEVIPVLVATYENDSDPGIHAAAAWVLRKWNHREQLNKIDAKFAIGRVEGGREWYVNRHRQTFSVVDASRRPVRGPENVPAHRYAVAATEVTVAQFRAFKPDHKISQKVATTLDSPVSRVSWYLAAGYCNCLSKEEGIPEDQWCYRENKEGLLDFVPDFQKRTGYRLPTELEWEFACRADAQTSCSFGEVDEELVGHYAWWFGNARGSGVNKSFPVASLKPNDWGLFDMHGNLAEWCQDVLSRDALFDDILTRGRGSAYYTDYHNLGGDAGFTFGRKNSFDYVGFRLVRTLN